MRTFMFAAGLIAALALGGCSGGGDDHAATTSETTKEATAGARWVISDLGTFGGPESNAVAINGRGQIIGYSYMASKDWRGQTPMHAFLWQDGKMRDLGTLGGPDSHAIGFALDLTEQTRQQEELRSQYARELKIARTLQRSLVPAQPAR